MHGYHTQKQQGWILSGRLRWEEGINLCHFTQRAGLNLCGTFLLFFLARALNYATEDIPISYVSTCFKTSRGTELSTLLMQTSALQKGESLQQQETSQRTNKYYYFSLQHNWKPLTLQMKNRCCSTRLP